jgi:hypothetical protein
MRERPLSNGPKMCRGERIAQYLEASDCWQRIAPRMLNVKMGRIVIIMELADA